jgi:H+/Cl- antiporter ClcA
MHSPGHWLESYRLRVARHDAVLSLALLGIAAGVLAGMTIVIFRLLVQESQHLVSGQEFEAFGDLSKYFRFWLPVAGGLAVGLFFQCLAGQDRSVGIIHVLHRLAYHQGHLPWRNAIAQFVGGAVTLISGHSVGREGPSAHLGAASSNIPAQRLGLPNNSLRITAACGTAAGIAASFNTPLAGVAFAMEVLMLNYTLTGLAPVILATVSATMISQWALGDQLAFTVPPVKLDSLTELPFIMVSGIGIGLVGAGFIMLVRILRRQSDRLPVWLMFTTAGTVVGLCGMLVPEVMGIGDQTITDTLNGVFRPELLFLILVFKLVATLACIGLGIPGGTIGPALVIGAAGGALMALAGQWLGISGDSAVALYALVGMGAMMAAILQAPLAGLIAVLELTGNPNVILPGMLAVVTATLTTGLFTERTSIFLNLLRQLGLDYRNDPVIQSRRRIGVAAAMERDVVVLPRKVSRERITSDLGETTRWVLLREDGESTQLLAATDLVNVMKKEPEQEEFDLQAIPGERLQVTAIDLQASLQDAHERMQETGAEALHVTRQTAPGIYRTYGVLTPDRIEQAWHY